MRYEPATAPTFYFIGVTTGQSSIMRIFPKWAKLLNLDEAVIKGIDLPLHAPKELYQETVAFIKSDPLSLGALVTTHKLDLFSACHDMFDYIDPYAKVLAEVSSLSKKDGMFCAHAKDPISSGLALEHFVPREFWKNHQGEVLLIGAGGSALAMSMYLIQEKFAGNYPQRITIANRSEPRLHSAKQVIESLHPAVDFSYVHSPAAADNDMLIESLPQYSLIVNATGLGKDAPGSPTTNAVNYPSNCLVWEINYRGELLFMDQAQKQAEAKHLHIEDGWQYFIHGWSQVIAEVFHIHIDHELLKRMALIADGKDQ